MAHGRRAVAAARVAVAALVLACVPVVAAGLPTAPARADVVTAAQDPMRTGWDSAEPGLGQSVVASSAFGQLFAAPLDGQVYAQPLVVGSTVVAATEADSVYALDSATGAVRWSRNVGKPWNPATVSCGDLTPSIGITSTPVYDPATNGVYVTAKTDDGPDPQHPNWYLHGLDLITGAERPGFPVLITGAPANDPAHPFDPETAAQRPGLLLVGGVVYAGFASHCDIAPYVGYVVGVSTAGRQTAMWSTESGNATGEAGIWQSGSGLVSDGRGILFATGNGIPPQPSPGGSPPGTLGESVVRLTVQADGSLKAADFFSPSTNAKLNQDDADLGSGGPLAVPDGYGTPAHPHLLVQMGKDGRMYVLDRDALGGMAQGPGGSDAVLATAGPYNGVWGRSAFLGTTAGGYVYDVGNGGYLRAFTLSATAGGGVAVAAVGASAGTFPYTSGSPVVTSDGTNASSALVWVVYSGGGPTGTSSELRAYRAVPDSTGVLQQVFAAPIGTSAKFSSPATSGGHVYVGTRDGKLLAFGAPTRAALGAASTDVGSAPVGSTGSATVTVTATRALTLTAATATAPFTVGGLALPKQLAAGASVPVPVSFSPTGWGQVNGTLSLTTSDGETVALDVHGLGTRDGLGANPASLAFPAVPTGSLSTQTVNVVNTGTRPVTITGLTAPASSQLRIDPGSAQAVGEQLQPQQSLAVPVTYAPTSTAGVTDALVVASSLGSVTVPVTGTAVSGAPHLTIPSSLAFGDVPVGLSRTLTFPITNDGNLAMTVTKAKAPAGLFTTSAPIAEGLAIPPGDTAYQSVTFTPTATGAAGGPDTYYLVTTDDGTGAHEVLLTGNGVADPLALLGAQHGGSYGTPLGVVASAPFPAADGTCQSYTNGYVCSSPTAGAHWVSGEIGKAYRAAGGPTGQLGLPTTDETGTPTGGGRFNHFSGMGGNASIYWTAATGAHVVDGAVRQEWAATGWETRLGFPTTDEFCGLVDGGCGQHFTNGSIYRSPASGAHYAWGAIGQEWAATGWERNLGYPTTDEFCGLVNGGCGQHFTHGSVYWSPATGAHLVRGAIRDWWSGHGWERGRLGYPTGDEFCGLVNGGCGQHFQGGSVYWSPATGAHEVWGAFADYWSAAGWERSTLGYPTGDERSANAMIRQDFAHGYLLFNPRSGQVSRY